MTLNTENQRRSVHGYSLFAPVNPVADGHISAADQRHVALLFHANFNPVLSHLLEADLDRDGTFNAANADLTAYFKRATWLNGFPNDQNYAALHPSTLTLFLNNDGGDFFPENASSDYYGLLVEGTLLRLRVTDGDEYWTLYIGKLATLDVPVGRALTEKDAILTLESPVPQLLKSEYASELFVDATIDEAIEAIFERGLVPWPYETSHWFLGVAGASELGETTTLFENTVTDFEAGVTEQPFIGDNLDRGLGVNPAALIQQAAEADLARFWWEAREGLFKLFNREHFTTMLTANATFGQDDILIDGSEYVVDPVVNDVTLVYEERESGTPGDVVYLHPNLPIQMVAPFERTFTVRYNTVDDVIDTSARIGVQDGIPPVAGTDYQVSDENPPTGESGDDETHYVSVSATFFADRADIHVRMTRSGTRYLHRLQLRGTPLISQGRQEVKSYHAESVAARRVGIQTLVIPTLSDPEYARSYVDYVAALRADPIPRFSAITLLVDRDGPVAPDVVLSLAIGSRITLGVADISHDRDYFVIGERHDLDAGRAPRHLATLYLTPASRVSYWQLGVAGASELGETTRLSF